MRSLLAATALLALHAQVAAQTTPHPASRELPSSSKFAQTDSWLSSHTGGKIACTGGRAASYPCKGIDLLSRLSMSDYGGWFVNDVWGWTDPETGREYALAGRSDAVAFVDVTDQLNPVYVGELLSHSGEVSYWRDMKVYRDHMFVVVDGTGANGMQVFDLTRLRSFRGTPIRFSETAHYDGVTRSHNVAINEASGFAYIVGAASVVCPFGLHMVDIRSPQEPTYAGCFRDQATGRSGGGYTHDAQCTMYRGPDAEHAGKEICFGSNETALSVADVTDKRNPVALSRADYPNVTYSHQGWLTEDHRYFIMNDELDEYGGLEPLTRMLIWDVVDLDDPVLLTEYIGPTPSIDHNLYVKGSKVYAANYTSGLRIIDIASIEAPHEVAFFDTHTQNDHVNFDGAWTAFPYFESGIIVVNSYHHGLFVLAEPGHEVYSGAALRQTEYPALVALFRATGGNDWSDRSNWALALSGRFVAHWAIEQFYGVQLDRDNVANLDLANNNLSGKVPSELGQLQQLRMLDLSGNELEGRLPMSLMQLSRLEELRFGGQALCAPRDDAFQSWLGAVPVVDGPTCVPVAFSPTGEMQDFLFTVGEPIGERVLPEATGGSPPYTYEFAPEPPPGLTFDPATRTLSGTP